MTFKIGNGLDLSSQRIVHVADGSASDDAATYGQVLALVNGLVWKKSARAASTANVNLASPGATMDGVTLANNDRVLLKNQTAAAENGIYQFNGSSSALTRATDFNSSANIIPGSTIAVLEGTAAAPSGVPTQWTLALDPDTTITVGTTALPFTQTGAGTVYTAGNGLNLSGGAFSVKLPGSSGLVVDGTGVYVDTTKVVEKYAANVGDGSSTSLAVAHNLGTRDVTVSIQDSSTHAMILTDWVATDVNTVTLTFATAPSANAYRVTVHG